MKISILNESGYNEALLGLGLSYNITDKDQLQKVSQTLYNKDGGHNKFLESIMVWLKIDAPLYWYNQLDTYRIGTKQSTSTMHTLMKKQISQDMFEVPIPNIILDELEKCRLSKDFIGLRRLLPSSFIQTRICCYSYKTLRNIYKQRLGHKLPEWDLFCNTIIKQLVHPEYIEG